MTLEPNVLLVSFEISLLLTKVSIRVFDLLSYFLFHTKSSQQTSGTPMGSHLSPVVADSFIEAFQTMILDSSSYKLNVCLGYLDETNEH